MTSKKACYKKVLKKDFDQLIPLLVIITGVVAIVWGLFTYQGSIANAITNLNSTVVSCINILSSQNTVILGIHVYSIEILVYSIISLGTLTISYRYWAGKPDFPKNDIVGSCLIIWGSVFVIAAGYDILMGSHDLLIGLIFFCILTILLLPFAHAHAVCNPQKSDSGVKNGDP